MKLSYRPKNPTDITESFSNFRINATSKMSAPAEVPTFKLVLVGDGGTGKVCLALSLILSLVSRQSDRPDTDRHGLTFWGWN